MKLFLMYALFGLIVVIIGTAVIICIDDMNWRKDEEWFEHEFIRTDKKTDQRSEEKELDKQSKEEQRPLQ